MLNQFSNYLASWMLFLLKNEKVVISEELMKEFKDWLKKEQENLL